MLKPTPRTLFRIAPLATALLGPQASWAEAPAPQEETAPTIEEVVVTAQRREESQQKVPVAVTALSNEDVAKRGISNVQDLLQAMPNMGGFESPDGRGSTNVNIRGVPGGAPGNISLDPASGIYLDGVYIGKTTGNALDLPDIERIEVMRGPQGTLYGRNSTGGAVSFVTRKPSGELHTKATATVGSHGLWGVKVRQDLPSIGTPGEGAGTLATSLSYQTRQRDPLYGDSNPAMHGFEDINRDAYRLSALWQPADTVEVQYSYDHSNLNELPPMQQAVGLTQTDAAGTDRLARLAALQGVVAVGAGGLGVNPALFSRWSQSLQQTSSALSNIGSMARPSEGGSDVAARSKSEADGHNLTASWDLAPSDTFGAVTLKSITGYRKSHTSNTSDLDGMNNSIDPLTGAGLVNDSTLALMGSIYASGLLPAGTKNALVGKLWSLIDQYGAGYGTMHSTSDYSQLSQEFQALGETDHSKYVLGLYYFSDDIEFRANRKFLSPLGGINEPNYDMNTEAKAVFGQISYRPPAADDKLELTAGLRHTRESKDIQYLYRTAGDVLNPTTSMPILTYTGALSPASTYGDKFNDDFQNTSGRLAVGYQLTDDINLYTSYATGYRSGGFNGEVYNNPYDEETIKEYEVGAKTDWLEKRLRVNLAVFQYTYEDQQVSQVRIENNTATIGITNAGKADRWGSELEIIALPTDDLQLALTYGHLYGDYKEYASFCGTATCIAHPEDLARRPQSADNQVGLAIDYLAARLGFANLNLHLDGQWQDESYAASFWTGNYTSGGGTVVTPVAYPQIVLDERTIINARVSLSEIEAGEGTMQVALWAKNVFNQDYRTFGINYGSVGLVTAQYGEPRTVGMDFSYEF